MTATPTQIARSAISDPRASRYLALSFAKLSDWRKRGLTDRNMALRLLRQNARDGRKALGVRCSNDTTLDRAALILYRAWLDTLTE